MLIMRVMSLLLQWVGVFDLISFVSGLKAGLLLLSGEE